MRDVSCVIFLKSQLLARHLLVFHVLGVLDLTDQFGGFE